MLTERKSGKNQTWSSHTIFIVEDDPDLSDLICLKLQKMGFTTERALTGTDAIAWIVEHPASVILLDYQLPDMTGLQIVETLNQQKCNTPFILMTAHTDVKLAVRMMKLGARDFLVKEKGFLKLLPTIVTQVIDQLETENKLNRAEEELRKSEERFRSVVDNIGVGIALISPKMEILSVNKQMQSWFPKIDVSKKPICYRVYNQPPKEQVCSFCPTIKSLQDGQVHQAMMEIPVGDKIKYYRIVTSPNKDKEGKVLAAIKMIEDITDRKQSEEALHNAHTETEQLLSSISSILIGVGPDHRITRWNEIAKKTFGIEEAEVLGKLLFESGIKWDWDLVQARISECRVKDRPTQLDDIRYTRPDEKEGFLRITFNPILNAANEQAGYLLLAADTTEHKNLESQLTQAQKLESIGQLAAGIAHEINTPIQYVGDNTRFLDEAFRDLNELLAQYKHFFKTAESGAINEETVKVIETAVEEFDLDYLIDEIPNAINQSLEGVEHVAKIVRSMKEFSHPGAEEMTTIDINKAIVNTITVSRNEWKYIADMVTDFDTDLPIVPCFPGEINQVILNIIINAAHAIADTVKDGANQKGTITVVTKKVENWIEIRISDTGLGIPENVRPKIFDPFFTTKEIGKGTGQGLAISHTVVVEKHNGLLSFETETGKGTTFIICLPINPLDSKKARRK